MDNNELKMIDECNSIVAEFLDYFVKVLNSKEDCISTLSGQPVTNFYASGYVIRIINKEKKWEKIEDIGLGSFSCMQSSWMNAQNFDIQGTEVSIENKKLTMNSSIAAGTSLKYITIKLTNEDIRKLNTIKKQINFILNNPDLFPENFFLILKFKAKYSLGTALSKILKKKEFNNVRKLWEEKLNKIGFNIKYDCNSFEWPCFNRGRAWNMSHVEAGRSLYSTHMKIIFFWEFLERNYGVKFKDEFTGLWFVSRFADVSFYPIGAGNYMFQQGKLTNILSTKELKRNFLRKDNYVQQSFAQKSLESSVWEGFRGVSSKTENPFKNQARLQCTLNDLFPYYLSRFNISELKIDGRILVYPFVMYKLFHDIMTNNQYLLNKITI